MTEHKLSQMEDATLTANLRVLRAALNNLAEVEADLIADQTIQQINDVYRRLEDELRRRGYSDEEIADLA